MDQNNDFSWELLPFGVVVFSIFHMWGAIIISFEDISTGLWVAIIGAFATIGAAVITGVIALVGQWRQAKRDGKAIDKINSDTSEMKPTVHKIDDNTSKIRDIVIESVVPSMVDVRNRNSKIDFIAGELEYQKRLQQDLPKDNRNRDTVLAEIRSVYERNAALSVQHAEAQHRISSLTAENAVLRSKIAELNAELQREQRKNSGHDMSDDLEIEP